MILPGATYSDIYKAITDEEDKVQYYWQKQAKKIIKEFYSQLNRDPMVAYTYYVNPKSRNKYLLWYATTPLRFVRNNEDIFGGMFLVVDDFTERDFYFTTGKDNCAFLLHVTSHFVRRYRERNLRDDKLKTETVLATYVFRNGSDFLQLDPDETNISKEKDARTFTNLVKDGIIYFQCGKDMLDQKKELVIIRYKTFVPHSALNDKQKSHIQERVREINEIHIKNLLNIPDNEKQP